MTESDLFAGRRVLLVEDEVMVSMMVEDMLADLGCAIVGPASRLKQALALAGADGIDVAILDVNLHGEKSFAVADTLAARGIPIVFATGYGNEGVPDTYEGSLVLGKPFQQKDLKRVLAEELQRG